jgi:hypothetical protein
MPNRFLCPKCRGQRTISCTLCGGSGKRLTAGITISNCKECNGTGQRRCDVCSGTGEIEAAPGDAGEPSGVAGLTPHHRLRFSRVLLLVCY